MPSPQNILQPCRPALVVNVHSRKARAHPNIVHRLRSLFQNRGLILESTHPAQLDEFFDRLRHDKSDLLFLCGGDGTLRQSISRLISRFGSAPLPAIALLKGGTMNTVAHSLGIHRSVVSHVSFLLGKMDRKAPLVFRKCRPLCIDQQYGFIFAVGSFSNFIEMYMQQKRQSPIVALKLLGQTALSLLVRGSLMRKLFVPFPVTITGNQKALLANEEVTTVSASAIAHIGFGFKPFLVPLDAKEFAGLVLTGYPRALLRCLLTFWLGRKVCDPSILQFQAHDMTIALAQPLVPMIDGDLLAPQDTFHIHAGPLLHMVVG